MGGHALRIATRSSPLALIQAELVAGLLRNAHPDLDVTTVPLVTEGDRRTDVPLSELGGKGVFATEVQAAVISGWADVAVHSAKDLPALTPPELVIGAVPERTEARDALIGGALSTLPTGAVVATGSRRRQVQLAHLRGDLRFVDLRGNMATRLDQVGRDGVAAVVVAVAALDRLGWQERLGANESEVLSVTDMVPQVGQGALAVECRADDATTRGLLADVEHGPTRRCVDAERAFLCELGGDCDLPAGAHAGIDGAGLRIRAVLAPGEWPTHPVPIARVELSGTDPVALGRSAAIDLRSALGELA
ncbi:MAG: hydroxymethylbilane synthase [Actinobacteria bacterium]|nr:hydroxymethylbilane synthase [Actinomycetota bacterium]